jgi:hypothetical protein
MPIFIFVVQSPADLAPAEHEVELPDLRAAEREALISAAQLAGEGDASMKCRGRTITVDVFDSARRPLLTARMILRVDRDGEPATQDCIDYSTMTARRPTASARH